MPGASLESKNKKYEAKIKYNKIYLKKWMSFEHPKPKPMFDEAFCFGYHFVLEAYHVM